MLRFQSGHNFTKGKPLEFMQLFRKVIFWLREKSVIVAENAPGSFKSPGARLEEVRQQVSLVLLFDLES